MRAKGQFHLHSERNIGYSWLNTVVTKRRNLGYNSRFLFTWSLWEKKRGGERCGEFHLQQNSAVSESKDSGHQSPLWARYRGIEQGGEAAKAYSLQSLSRISAKGKKEREREMRQDEEGGKKEKVLLLPRKEHELDRVLLRRLSPDSTIGSLYRLQ